MNIITAKHHYKPNFFLCLHETKWLKNYPKPSNQIIIKDMLITIMYCLENRRKFYRLLTIWIKHKIISFPFETKNDNVFSFFKDKIYREKDKITTSIFMNATFIDRYTCFSSFRALEYKFVFI